MHAVSLTITEGPVDVEVRTDKVLPKDYHQMSCKFAGSNIPAEDNPWRRGSEVVNDEIRYHWDRDPKDGTEGVVTWKLQFLDVSKDSKVFGSYSCELDKVKSNNATLRQVGE